MIDEIEAKQGEIVKGVAYTFKSAITAAENGNAWDNFPSDAQLKAFMAIHKKATGG